MFNNISWQGYWTSLAIIVSLYYAYLLLFYFKPERLSLVRYLHKAGLIHSSAPAHVKVQTALFSQTELTKEDPEVPDSNPAVISLVDEIQAFFEAAAPNQFTKEFLLQVLRELTRKYPGVRGSAYQHSVSNLIVFLAEQTCSLHLSAEEVKGVWLT